MKFKRNKNAGIIANIASQSSSQNEKNEGLHIVREVNNEAAIIFVHGLGGHPYRTWTKKNCDSLPHLLVKDESYNRFDLFTFGYKTGFVFKRHHFKQISDLLYTEIKARLNHKEIYFITHSMGGVVVQRMLIEQVERSNDSFIQRIRGIVYLAVPFAGSTIASIASKAYAIIPPIIGEYTISVQVRSLKILSEELAEQSVKWFRYTSNQLSQVRQKNIYGQSDRTVATASSNAAYISDTDVVEENHRSICKIDSGNTVYRLLIDYFKRKSNERVNVAETQLDNYLQWLKAKTNTFIVPGIQIPLPIEDAWAGLQVLEHPSDTPSNSLETALVHYHEWERLSRNTNTWSAQDVTELGKRLVLIGGPGSGKSTLARRTAHRLANLRQKTVYVRLSNVCKEMVQGKSFEESLWSVATDGYAGDKNLLKPLLAEPDALIADGLDECEPHRRMISAALHEWTLGRLSTRVVLTTRPIGYESTQFHTYHHAEIVPLNNDEIHRYAKKLISILIKVEKDGQDVYASFKRQMESNRTVKVAARSPLLLNFLIQLAILGKPFGTYRAELYDKILEEWIRESERGEQLGLNPQIAIRSLEYIGWLLQKANENGIGRSEKELLLKITSFLEDELQLKRLEAQGIASRCLKYWVEKGVLEHLRIGYEDAYTFIHLTFGEFTAARYLSSLEDSVKKQTVIETHRLSSWRETILLAGGLGSAGLIVETLLAVSTDPEGIFNDIVLAAAVLGETRSLPDSNKKVTERLIDRISSPFPVLCYEAVEALKGIACQEGEWFISFIEPLLTHQQEWTRLAGHRLALAAGMHVYDANSFLEWISNPPQEKRIKLLEVPTGWLTWNETIVLGIRQLLESQVGDDKLQLITEALVAAKLSMRSLREVIVIFKEYNRQDLVSKINEKFSSKMPKIDFGKMDVAIINGELAIIRAAIKGIEQPQGTVARNENGSLIQISTLYHGMQLGECTLGDLQPVVEGIDSKAVETVVKGIMAAFEVQEDELYSEALRVFEKSDDRMLLSSLPDVFIDEPNWERAAASGLDKESLVRALSHPSHAIAYNATRLLAAGVGGEEVKPLVREMLLKGSGAILNYAAAVAILLLEEEVLDMLLHRLEDEHSEGFRYLYDLLSKVPGVEKTDRLHQVLVSGIGDSHPLVVKAAAKAIIDLETKIGEDVVREAVVYWNEKGVLCDTHGIHVKGSSCPECHTVPESPLPELLSLLINFKSITFDEALYYSNHDRSDVREIGLRGLSYCLSFDLDHLYSTVIDIHEGRLSWHLLDAVFNVEHLGGLEIKKQLYSLIESENPEVRRRLVQEVTETRWFNEDEAKTLLGIALRDIEPDVRNQAVVAYRNLKSVFNC
ncbi:alpha/beta fold hydrolase [Paenibacillus andongensis]|uniref:alpha/beta fold hydrolase n=1 Tax=Paenibacillus andongensis TaxID=2975482 RepID=UPI0021BB6388|nr:alpha/beta fold hydrolase [Paenibacillus andongensis]